MRSLTPQESVVQMLSSHIICSRVVLLMFCVSISMMPAAATTGTVRQVGPGQTYTTIQACLNAAVSGDTCNVHAGTFNENPMFKGSGVTLQANPGDQPIVKGFIEIGANANSVVDGFTIPSFSHSGSGGIHAQGATSGVIRNNVVSGGTGAGIYTRQCTNFEISGNTVHGVLGSSGSDGDGMFIISSNSTDGTYPNGVRIHDNTVYENHQDGIDINGSYISVYRNYVHDNIYSNWASYHPDGMSCNGVADGFTGCPHTLVYQNTFSNQTQNIYFQGNGTAADNQDIWIFDNVVFNTTTSSTGVAMASATAAQIILGVGQYAYIFNNTIGGPCQYFGILLGDGSGANDSSDAFTNVTIENNIITGALYYAVWTYPSSNVTAMDYNLYYGNYAMVRWGTTSYTTLASLQSGTGMETHGQSSNPLLNAFPTPTLQTGSPAIGAGLNLTSLGIPALDTDKAGTARPASGVWDMGAYEYGSKPSPPTNLTATVR